MEVGGSVTLQLVSLERFKKNGSRELLFGASALLSDNAMVVIVTAIRIVLGTGVALLAAGSNVINMAVFARRGLGSSMYVSFFSLSTCNLTSACLILWMNIHTIFMLFYTDMATELNDVVYLTGGWPAACILRISSWVTAYITAERCACVAFPLKVKRMMTPRRTAASLATVVSVNIAALAPVYSSVYVDRKLDSEFNTSSTVLAFGPNRDFDEGMEFTLHAVLVVTSLVVLVTFTFILIGQLEQNSKWREDKTFDRKQIELMSVRQKRTVALVIVVASVMIVCYSPLVTLSLVEILVTDFRASDRYANVYKVSWAAAFLLGTVSSSVNILLYYKMSSKYRETYQELVSLCWAIVVKL